MIIISFLISLLIVYLLSLELLKNFWKDNINKQVIIQIISPLEQSIKNDVSKVLQIIRSTKGVIEIKILTKKEIEQLLNPWIKNNYIKKELNNKNKSILDELLISSIIIIQFSIKKNTNLDLLRKNIETIIPNINIDNYNKWSSNLFIASDMLKIFLLIIIIIIIIAVIIIIFFTTKTIVNNNVDSIRILFLIGAKEFFIIKEICFYFCKMILKASIIGTLSCICFILFLKLIINIIYYFQFNDFLIIKIFFEQINLSIYECLYLMIIPFFITLISGIVSYLTIRIDINHIN